ncbi:hypothetical protein J4G43_021660 [Bradyrhizobium barranii subsp. barranii]|uniref:Uncharacterized protein n=1 Tax=Bradyrhizobium barranii subsp. barranii TaxID=2823807 RepID=A0A939M9M5_9BRAD|nr:hypothetical protein [Bradyrhizobium barranii]UEM16588.1 hypothetical protein J4G43_021660 [Bradyrhizobium barranii subsp. barranii]
MSLIEFNGETRTVADWARLIGIHPDTLGKRLALGWSVEEALTTPVGKQGRKPKPIRAPSIAHALPALRDWQRDMHAAHRQMTRSVRSFVRQMEEQMAELRHGLDQHLAAQRDEANRNIIASHTPGVGQNPQEIVRDRCSRVAQESV